MTDKTTTLPTMEQMTLMYLFGQLEKPSNLIDGNLVRPTDLTVDYPVKVNINEYMTNGAGRFVNAKSFDFVNDFFDKNTTKSKNLMAGRYTKSEIFKLLDVDEAWVGQISAFYDDGKDNTLERAYIWNTVAFKINDDAIFVIDEDGSRSIENFAIVPHNNEKDENNNPIENFDFTGGGWSQIANSQLRWKIDPSGIGRTVNIKFDWDNIDTKKLTEQDFENMNSISPNVISGVTVGWDSTLTNNLVKELWDSGVIQFLDENNHIVLYGSHYGVKEVPITNPVYGEDIPSKFYDDLYQLYSEMGAKVEKGIVFVMGDDNGKVVGSADNDIIYGNAGNDIINAYSGDDIVIAGNSKNDNTDKSPNTLIGGQGKDELYGSAGNDVLIGGYTENRLYDTLIKDDGDADRLEGGDGFDTYHVGNKDTICDTDGKGVVFFNGNKLGNFQQDEHNQSLWYEINNNGEQTGITAMQQGNNLLIADGNENAITIENYFQAAQILSGSYFGLNIRLNTQEESKENEENEEPQNLIWCGDVRPETDENGRYKVNWTDHSQRDENGFLINGEYQDGFNDVMVGQNGVSNHIYGLGGNDALSGGNGDDIIDGGDGDDLITGGGGSDVIYGGVGDDNIYSNRLSGAPYRKSDDDVWSTNNKNYVSTIVQGATWGIYHTTSGVDIVDGVGNNVNDVTKLGDMLYGGSGNDDIIGGNRNDVIYGDELDSINTQSTKDGNDSLYGMGGDDLIYGNGGDDFIYGDGKADNASKGIFQYSAISEHGNDIIYSGSGDDSVYGNAGDDMIFGEDGDDWISGDFNNTAVSTQFADDNGDDYIDGGNGNDEIHGGGGNDTVIGGDGDDLVLGDYGRLELAEIWGNDYIDGGLGNDQILGGGGDDYLMGDKGDDFIIGDYFTQELIEILGSDVIDGGDGNDQLIGGAGNDTLLGGNGNDKLWGDFDNTIGIDIVGNDYLDGGDGDDEISGGAGDDVLIGGKGNDKLFGDFDIRPEFAHIVGNDYLDGGDGNDYLDGGNGDDTLIGGLGNDVLLGDFNVENNIAGEDYLDGGDGDDYLNGGDADDVLIAGKGKDSLLGGKGNDLYLFNNEDLQDGQINYIMDEDGKGNILIDNVYLHQHNWRAIAPNIWRTDTMQLRKIIQDEHTFLLWQSQQHTSTIIVQDYQDGDLNINLPSFLIPENPTQPTVHSNHAPQISNSIDAQTIYINQNWTFRLPENLFTDPDGDTLTYHITNLPNWLTYDEQSHSLTGTASIDDIGTHTLNITATDPKGANVTSHFHLNITHPNIHNAQYLSGSQNGTMKADLLIGDEHNNIIRGLAGDDEIYGKDGEDQINGNNGNDRIDGGKGDDQLHGGNGNDTLIGGEGNDLLNGNAGNDILNGEDGDDLFYGGVGNDKLYGGKGNDRLWGGAGNDYLQGGLGNDTYIFDSDFGQDIINNHDTSKQRNDIIRFKDERNANDFTYIRQDQHLIISAKANDDQIIVQNHFHEENEYRIDALHFQDGSILTSEDIANIIATNEQQTEDIDPEETETYHLEEIMPDWRYEDEEENDVWL